MIRQLVQVEVVKVSGYLLARIVSKVEWPLNLASNANIHEITILLRHDLQNGHDAEDIADELENALTKHLGLVLSDLGLEREFFLRDYFVEKGCRLALNEVFAEEEEGDSCCKD